MEPTSSLRSRITLRDYTSEDRSIAIDILRRGFLDGLDSENNSLYNTLDEWCNSVEHYYDDIRAYVGAHNGGRFFIARDENNEVVGTVGIKVSDEDSKKKRGELVRLSVNKKFRGQKIGKFLYNYGINYAKNELNLSVLYLKTLDVLGPAVGMYTKYGFKEVSREPFGTEAIQLTMEMNLTSADNRRAHSPLGRLKAFIKKSLEEIHRK